MANGHYVSVSGTPYEYDGRLTDELNQLRQRVNVMRSLVQTLSDESLARIQEYFRLKNIYNSNAIEGNMLSIGETRLVIEQGLTITGKPLKDSVEARNLSHALDFFEELADRKGEPITIRNIRNIHNLILKDIDSANAGSYRTVFVKISGSEFDPPDPAQIERRMNGFGMWLEQVSQPGQTDIQQAFIDPLVLACAAHAWFVYIHPFIDGNGRTARLLMNLLLMRYGYPLTIITKDDRQRYYDALETSQASDLTPFIRLVLESAMESIEVYEKAAEAQLNIERFVQTLNDDRESDLRNQYEIFESTMRLFKGYFGQTVKRLDDDAKARGLPHGVELKDFGALEFEKYQSIRLTQTAKKTWFFRLTFYDRNDDDHRARYLFFFGFASNQMAEFVGENEVTLHTATEVEPYHYERIASLDDDALPAVREVGYLPDEEKFIYLDNTGAVHRVRAEDIAIAFIKEAFAAFSR